MFENPFKKKAESTMEAVPEAFKDFDYLMKQGYNAKVVSVDEYQGIYEIMTDITTAPWYSEAQKNLDIDSEKIEKGYRITIGLKETADDELENA